MDNSVSARINTIDSFRFFAVTSVVVYHYYARFSPPLSPINYLPYQYSIPQFINYGFFGVQIFFIISGFVIHHTLHYSKGLKEFFIKRLIRLVPTLLICSIITFLFQNYLDYKIPILQPLDFIDFFPGLTFTPPQLWNFLIGIDTVNYVDYVYWSLFVEMLFYITASYLFYKRPASLTENWTILTFTLILIRIICSPKLSFLFPEEINTAFEYFYSFYLDLHLSYLPYFGFGLFFYSLYKRKITKFSIIGFIAILCFEMYFLHSTQLSIILVGFILLFIIFIYYPKFYWLLNNRLVLWIGMISYPVYLIHQNLGLILMNRFAAMIEFKGWEKYLPLLTILIILLFSSIIHYFFEKPIGRFLKMRFIEK